MNYGIPFHMYGKLNNQNHDSAFGKAEINVTHSILKSSHMSYIKKYVPYIITLLNFPRVVKTDLVDGGIMINLLIMNGPMMNHHLLYFCKET